MLVWITSNWDLSIRSSGDSSCRQDSHAHCLQNGQYCRWICDVTAPIVTSKLLQSISLVKMMIADYLALLIFKLWSCLDSLPLSRPTTSEPWLWTITKIIHILYITIVPTNVALVLNLNSNFKFNTEMILLSFLSKYFDYWMIIVIILDFWMRYWHWAQCVIL